MKNYVLLFICGVSTLVAKDLINEPTSRPAARNIIVIPLAPSSDEESEDEVASVTSSQAASDLEAASTAAQAATSISTASALLDADFNESELDEVQEVDDNDTVVDASEHPEIAALSDDEAEL